VSELSYVFVQRCTSWSTGLRASLVALYRYPDREQMVAGEELELLTSRRRLAGPPLAARGEACSRCSRSWSSSARLWSSGPAFAATTAPRVWKRSPAFRVIRQRHEDGRRFLSNANPMATAEPNGSDPRFERALRPGHAPPSHRRACRADASSTAARRPVRDRGGAAEQRRFQSTRDRVEEGSCIPACTTPTSGGRRQDFITSRSRRHRSLARDALDPRRYAPRCCSDTVEDRRRSLEEVQSRSAGGYRISSTGH